MIDNNGYKVRYGLNARWHPDLVKAGFYDAETAVALSAAKHEYEYWYWLGVRGDLMTDQDVANKVFDQSVPLGVGSVAQCLQRALCELTGHDLMVDGHIGTVTIVTLNENDGTSLMPLFKQELLDHYDKVVLAHPEYAADLPGWIARVNK